VGEGVIDDETSELMTCNLCTKVDADLSRRTAVAVQRTLQNLRPGERILFATDPALRTGI